VEQHNLVKQAKTALAELDRITSKGAGASKKSSQKHKKEATATAEAPEPYLPAMYQLDLKKAREAAENARGKAESAAQDMFHFYANSLSIDVEYAWNKIVQERTQSNPYTDLQGISRKRPRELSRKAFDDCVMFHLLTMFPNNMAEQERYYLTNMLKKLQHISSTPTLSSCHAGTTAQVPRCPPQSWQMFHSLRLTWRVTFCGCAHLHGRTTSTFTRKV
jgi:hypothetical protein